MRGHYVARAARIVVAVVILLLALMGSATAYAVEASSGGSTEPVIVDCFGSTTDNPGSGPETAAGASGGPSTEAWLGLCLATENSGGRSPAPVLPPGACGLRSADTITIQSHRGIGWVCP